jgi:hypothetical protein
MTTEREAAATGSPSVVETPAVESLQSNGKIPADLPEVINLGGNKSLVLAADDLILNGTALSVCAPFHLFPF